jgi:outer membrane beta-barrel protein
MRKRTALLSLGLVAGLLAISSAARAQTGRQERRSPLADAPAVRNRLELRDSRFELGVGAATTLGQDFYHAVLVGGKLSFHANSWLALTASGGFNVTPDFTTSFHDELIDRLPPARGMDRTPTQADAVNGMNRIGQMISAGAELTPFAGKVSLFGKLFANYDTYVGVGVGFINFQQAGDKEPCAEPINENSCPVVGMKIGPTFVLGAHAFLNDFVALNLEVRDTVVRNNPAGRDENGDLVADQHDLSWDHNYVLGLNVTFFLPSQAKVTE